MDKKLLVSLTMVLFLLTARSAHADYIGGASAALATSSSYMTHTKVPDQQIEFQIKRLAIQRVLARYNSPMLGSVDTFISECEKYDMDCYMLPAIAGLESTFGRHIYPDSYNAFGWGGGYIMFDSWDEGIQTVSKGLNTKYVARGAKTVDQIGPIYSESPTWAVRVNSIIRTFEKEEAKIRLFFAINTVEL